MMGFLRVQGTFQYVINRVYAARISYKTGFCDVCCAAPKDYDHIRI